MDALKAIANFQERQRAANVAEIITLLDDCDVPWPKELVDKLSLMGMSQAEQVLKCHPGYDLYNIWQSIKNALDIFRVSCDDVRFCLDDFHEKAQTANFFSRRRSKEFELSCLQVNKCMYQLASISVALEELSRRYTGKFCPDNYIQRHDQCYKSPEYHFIKGLRRLLHHQHFEPANYVVRKIDKVNETEFYIRDVDLLEHDCFNQVAKSVIEKAGERVIVRPIFEQYEQSILTFYKWVDDQLNDDERFVDFIRCNLARKQNAARVWWSVIMNQIEAKGLDPYEHLHDHFTDDELEEINKLPHRSKEQVDKMIEIYDTDKACNEEIKERIYKFLRIS